MPPTIFMIYFDVLRVYGGDRSICSDLFLKNIPEKKYQSKLGHPNVSETR